MLGNRMFETVLVNQLCKRYVLCHGDNTNVFILSVSAHLPFQPCINVTTILKLYHRFTCIPTEKKREI